jgi:hypothetical protein
MSEEKMNLARRAVACPGWRWLPGMRHTTMIKGEEWFCCRVAEKDAPREPRHPDALPDLDDPATLGCLLALVREVSGARAHVVPARSWHAWVVASPVSRDFWGNTEAEALVAALEAAGR